MTMDATRLPAAVTLRTTADGLPADGLLVLVCLKMARKNDFDVVAGPSGPGGRLHLTAAALWDEVERTLRQFPADYHDPEAADGLTGVIEVMPMAAGDVTAALEAVELYGAVVPYPDGYAVRLRTAAARLDLLTAERVEVEVLNSTGAGVRYRTVSRPTDRAPLARTA